MIISMIAAMAKNRVIGCNKQLPWHLPADFKHFKTLTMGKPIIMGRRTYESIGKPLPGRLNIVITRNQDFNAEGVQVVASIEEALSAAGDVEEVMFIGGANLYQQVLPKAHRLYLTFIDLELSGDAFFPEWRGEEWREVEREHHHADEKNVYDYTFVILQRG